jgi:hypothetical protein
MSSELSSQEPSKIHPADQWPKSTPGPEPASDRLTKAPIVFENFPNPKQPSVSKTPEEHYTTGRYPKDLSSPNLGSHKGRVTNL